MGTQVPRFLSLFSGCGGLDLGFQQQGFRCSGAFELDSTAGDVYRRNFGDHVQVVDLSKVAMHKFPAADILVAGPPCQGFSTVGKRDPNDPRNAMLLLAARIGIAKKSRVIVIENVTGVTSGAHGRYWENVKGTLASAGYRLTDLKCDASDFGVPQSRQRRILLAWNTRFEGEVALLPKARQSLREALRSVENKCNHSPKWLAQGSDEEKIAKRIQQHQKLSNVRASDRSVHTWQIPEVFGRTNKFERKVLTTILRLRRRNRVRSVGDADPVSARTLFIDLGTPVAETLKTLVRKSYVRRVNSMYDLAQTFNGKFRRLSWDHLASTVDTRFGEPRYFLHPVEHRGLSVREAARIQGFPDDFIFYGPVREQFRMVGNAVPPPLATAIAQFVRRGLLGSTRSSANG